MAIDFNPEDKITYEDLSKSLRTIIDSMKKYLSEDQQTDISKIGTRIEELDKRAEKLKKNGGIQESIWTGDMKESSSKGQVLKVRCPTHKIDMSSKTRKEINTPGTIYTHDEFMEKRVVTNDDELDQMFKRTPDEMHTIFNTWIRYAHYDAKMIRDYLDRSNWSLSYPEGQNRREDQYTVYTDKTKDGWSFNEKDNTICANYDYMPAAGFISPANDKYYYYLYTMVDVGWDDDNLMVVVGYTKDAKGIEHTLSVVRGCGKIRPGFRGGIEDPYGLHIKGIDTIFWWGLIYDMCNPTQYILLNLSKFTPSSIYSNRGSNSKTIAYVTVTREANYLYCKTTDFSADGSNHKDIEKATFEFSCPDTRPADWSPEMYENIKEMMTKPNHVGFGCRSGLPRFTIVDQSGIFDDTDIYALHQNKQYYFNYFTNKWEVKQKITDNKDISPKTFLYNKFLNNLVFLNRETDVQPFTWSKLELDKMPAYKKIKF